MGKKKNISLTGLLESSSLELKDNTVIVVLGASGDLAKKKTVMAMTSPVNLLHGTDRSTTVSCVIWLGWSKFFAKAR